MSSFFRNFNSFTTKRENAVKEALINTLSENAREIQYEIKQSGCDCLELCEVTNSLCTTLEAIFLHGLKDSFLWQTINVIAGDVERRPEPSFWSPLMVFLHKQVIEQVQTLSQITSEIGQCRAWIRLSLNECLFSSYLNNMGRNSSALSPYYNKFALIKDSEGLEMAAKLMEGMEANIQFNLPVNSSLLNQWPDYALQLSGLWTPPLKSCPISSGLDVAGAIPADTVALPTPQPVRTNELFSESISNSPFSRPANFGGSELSQSENVDILLRKVDAMEIIDEEDNSELTKDNAAAVESGSDEVMKDKKDKTKRKRKPSKELGEALIKDNNTCNDEATDEAAGAAALDVSASSTPHGNSLLNLMQTSWSDAVAAQSLHTPSEDGSQHGHHFQRSSSLNSSISYGTLLRKHERNRAVDWTEVWEKFLIQNTSNLMGLGVGAHDEHDEHDENARGEHEQDVAERSSNSSYANSDYELVTNSALEKFDIIELQDMVEKLCKLAHEPGLDAQGFLCKLCQHPLGIGYSNFRVCAFSGNYFCDKCMDLEPMMIPAKIIYNWDFRKYAVSKRAATFLAEFRNQPFIDLELLNPDIYNASEAMAELQSLRIRLNFIRAYLYTCGSKSIELLQRQFFGKDYLYEHIHQYSIGDLSMILRGTLYQQLQKAYKIGEGHVLNCGLCGVKGFICEKCKSPRVLYPFHLETTYRCVPCGAVYHAECLNDKQPCPRCERRRKRIDMPDTDPVEDVVLT